MHITSPVLALALASGGPTASAATRAVAEAAERAARDFRAGLVSVETLICASDRAFHAARRAERAAAATGCPEMAEAAARARCAYRVGQPV